MMINRDGVGPAPDMPGGRRYDVTAIPAQVDSPPDHVAIRNRGTGVPEQNVFTAAPSQKAPSVWQKCVRPLQSCKRPVSVVPGVDIESKDAANRAGCDPEV